MSYLQDNDILISFMSETWLTENQNNVTAVIKSYGYNIIHKPRSDDAKTRGGGVAIVFKKSLNFGFDF